jgi:hypothetical protein
MPKLGHQIMQKNHQLDIGGLGLDIGRKEWESG